MSERIHDDEPDTTEATVRALLERQCPEWSDLPLAYQRGSGTDNAEKPTRPSVPGGAFRARLFVFRLRDVGSRSTRLLADRSGCSVVDLYLRGVPVAVSNEPGTSRLEIELGQLHLSLDAIGHGRASSRTVIARSTADGLFDTRLAILR